MDDILDRLASMPRRVAHLVAEVDDERLDAAAPGEWSARTILAHLRDNESLVFRLRIQRMLAEDKPVFELFYQEPWEASRSRTRDRKETLLGDFALQRQATLNLVQLLRPEDFARTGQHPDRGPITIRAWIESCASHDDVHLAQLETVLGETLEQVLQRRFHDHR